MKILKLLNKRKLLTILSFFFLLTNNVNAVDVKEPLDIWKLTNEQKKTLLKNKNTQSLNTIDDDINSNSIYGIQSKKEKKEFEITEDETLQSSKINISGLYDPIENDLKIDMWSNSDGEKILEIFKKINKMELSTDAKEILNILILTNSYFPQKNISYNEFTKIKTDWLIKNNDLELIENYLEKNQNLSNNFTLVKFLIDSHLSNSELKKSCGIFSKLKDVINDDYISNFQIYCLIDENKREEAQLLFDIKKELGSDNQFFETMFNYLMGYQVENSKLISEKNILEFHLSHRLTPNFIFEPSKSTSNIIWKYLSSSNLLDDIDDIDLDDIAKINLIEKATHKKNYSEEELFNLYKRFQFSINQLLNITDSYKLLSNVEARALLYQGILITTEPQSRLNMIKILKNVFEKNEITNAFNQELNRVLLEIDIDDVPSNYTTFYNKFIFGKKLNLEKIKINNKIIHQSKLLNHLKATKEEKNIERDLNEILKKIKKNKDYYLSLKDIILLESFKSDGIILQKKYQDMYEVNNPNIPPDIQGFIDNEEISLVLLRIIEIIGEDNFDNMDPDTLYFIISALNQLNVDSLRNKILLKVLPLKV